jgi:two-component system chemotaxis response regulator CheY
MVVEDSASVRRAICDSLGEAGYGHLEAQDGVQAIAQLDGRKINLIICDVNMPNMDGITFVKTMRSLDNYRFTPVIMLTTESAESKRLEGQMAGAKAWLVKPFRPEQMMTAVAKLIRP